ncbi:pseudouridine synthase [Anaerosacchariphilus polymeriproducens]|uniref:Pseudouridine synthase n=1 Tax=Anaerosacchariphilus polymeriproducens TaxID=1812858 RepID=A0A371B066_9FIRM|nr:pseudouridine synthase [Anaerosacchariphilus polymeriproducens]RDU25196.1 pseudouridine synthase [Anaerosacchariphilus polymeriproducens]
MKTEKAEVRLNKYISDAGICSRREADRLIEEGFVQVDGKVAEKGQKITNSQIVLVKGKKVTKEEEQIVLLVNKPVGIVCTEEKREKENIIQFLNYPKRITYAGRLDKESQGLLLMTNDGDIINKMMRASNKHEKEYIVTVNKPIDSQFIKNMSKGVPILDTVTRKCKVEQLNKFEFRIVLTQGLNRQIRRMCEYFGYKVIKLERIRIMNLKLGDLKIGTYRKATKKEINTLYKMLGD